MRLTERANTGLHAHVLERILALQPRRDATILDVGCGTGALLARLREHGYRRLVGFDIEPPAGLEGVEVHAVDLDDCASPLEHTSVDLAVAVEVIEHVENVGRLLEELNRLLRPGGRVLLTTPNVHSLEARLRFLLTGELKQFDRIGDPTHVYPVFQFPFRRVLERHGFRVDDVWGFPADGFSATSRPSLRVLAGLARIVGLRAAPAGDQLCFSLRRDAAAVSVDAKRAQVTAHYAR
jgi:2-polyprenyl-3-methyl-5-hydroxy-6-metoxy-1,4-benzoquinol methylase